MNVLKTKKRTVELVNEKSAFLDALDFQNKYFNKYSIGSLEAVKSSLQGKIDLLNQMISIHPDKGTEKDPSFDNLPF